ncbi:HAD hydrolase family protein [Candidatus Enterococcus ferrettii]|uniref:Haloacid dehalogenase-like hydrolase n=1 Tax=Candidatus Enterococcus ferrettii TaxID=2815324 RepID=A0ABV0EPF8_9ENTE|nr:HAD hydrolase family protein [Enterococcus sp. 665A]MBO1343144.1 HAD hydrolase family protein [Enterococcus sp. 665A]
MNKRMKGLVFFNVEGVLLNKKNKLDFSMITAMRNLRWNGYLPIIVTDKYFDDLQVMARRLGINSIISDKETHVLLNGLELKDDEVVLEKDSEVVKEKRVRRVIQEFDDEQLKLYAFGNTEKDLALFKICNTRVAMGNACLIIKEQSSYITKSNSEFGVVEGLRYFRLI